jgi:methylmalonyl-CoA mutase
VLLAGRPGEHEAVWRAAGIDGFIHDGCDALAILGDTLEVVAAQMPNSP